GVVERLHGQLPAEVEAGDGGQAHHFHAVRALGDDAGHVGPVTVRVLEQAGGLVRIVDPTLGDLGARGAAVGDHAVLGVEVVAVHVIDVAVAVVVDAVVGDLPLVDVEL